MSTPASRHPSASALSEANPLGFAPAGAVLSFRTTSGWGNVAGNWAASVSTQAATFEAWIRTAVKDSQTIILGSDSPGAAPRISVGGDQISVYWNTGGDAPGWTSADTTPVTDGRWHHIAVVFDQGAITFYKDGVATTDQLTVSSPQQAAGDLQLGAGFGATTGFTGQMYGVRVWSVARTAQQIAQYRWAPLGPPTPGLTVAASFDPDKQEIVNQVGGGTGWLRVVGQADAASIPMSSHLFAEASSHVLPVTPTAHWLEVLDLAGAILVDPIRIVDGTLTARGPGLGLVWDEMAVAKYLVQ